jgi:hypothetical protein
MEEEYEEKLRGWRRCAAQSSSMWVAGMGAWRRLGMRCSVALAHGAAWRGISFW